jgi:hypothetical protein
MNYINDNLIKLLIIIIVLFLFYQYFNSYENFGALQSLYSNDGIQDKHISINSDGNEGDKYSYWRDVDFNIPTRNLNRIGFYPYHYEYHFDRYARLHPFW